MAKDNTTGKTTAPARSRTGIVAGAAVVGLAAVGALAYATLSGDPIDGTMVDSAIEDARPTGAGSLPDGAVDEYVEGLDNDTSRDDFIAPTAPTQGTNNPLLETDDGDTPSVTSIDELEPGPGVNPEVLERMAPDSDTARDGAAGQ